MIRSHEADQLVEHVSNALIDLVQESIRQNDSCTLALSGGSTPRALYKSLARPVFRNAVNWAKVQFFWGDERYVSLDDPASNYQMAYEAWLQYLVIPASNIHPMPTYFKDPEDSARAYENEIRRYVPVREGVAYPSFDLILLGIGEDGHTASLFPGDPALEEWKRWCVPSTAPVEPKQRLTLTLPMINAARCVWFLVTGESKAPIVKRVLNPSPHEPSLPAARVRPESGEVIWWLDSAIVLSD